MTWNAKADIIETEAADVARYMHAYLSTLGKLML